MLEDVISTCPNASKANYYLGCLFYDKLQFDRAIALWETSEKQNPTFPTVFRNLAIAYYNKRQNAPLAKEKLEKAFALDQTDARVFLELNQLYKKQNVSLEERLQEMEQHLDLVLERDDSRIEYITLLNSLGFHEQAYGQLMSHTFRPWEGAEGKVTAQYKAALCEMAKEKLQKQQYVDAVQLLEQALVYPENLGEGRLEGTKDNHLYYYLGCAETALGDLETARMHFEQACIGAEEPAGMMYYNDQPADMILYKGLAQRKLGNQKAANRCFYKLLDYGEQHLRDKMRIEYFAVSLPDFLIFEEDLDQKNEAHCYYLMGLAKLGLGKYAEANADFEEVLKRDRSHQNALFYQKMAQQSCAGGAEQR